MSDERVTEHFSAAEFACHDGRDVPSELMPNLHRLCADVLEPIRAQWGGPIIVISGWRSHEWNHKVGGALGSRHLSAEAADIRPIQTSRVDSLRSMIESMIDDGQLPALGGIGYYPRRWLHVDVRPRRANHIARWSGSRVGTEETT